MRPRSTELNSTEFPPPNFAEIISGIFILAAREGECVSVAKLHSTLYEMVPHESILSGLRFSLTGAICFSRDVDQAIKNLIDWRCLKIVGKLAFVIGGIHSFQTHLSRTYPKYQFQAIHSVSLRYRDRLRRDVRGPANKDPGRNSVQEMTHR